MIIGIPKEIKIDEYRVSVTPAGVKELVKDGHTVIIQSGAGEGSGFLDDAYLLAGALLRSDVKDVFDEAEMIVKVKEPIAQEYSLFKTNQLLFTYLHLAADKTLTHFLLEKSIRSFAYETLMIDKRLPLLEPMSEVAGKMASLMGAVHLGRYHGGFGVLPGGVVGTGRSKVMVLGGGVAGKAAAEIAAGLGAEVTIFDINISRLHYLNDVLPANVSTMYSSTDNIVQLLPQCDIVIGTVLIPGAKAPKLITRDMLQSTMKKGSVLVDVSIDQGGCFESSHPTTHSNPTYIDEGIVHYCVANMPGAYPRTSTLALTNATLPYVRLMAKGVPALGEMDEWMKTALNTYEGKLYNKAVGEAHSIQSQKA